ncbi:hypothetical protein ACWEP4_26905 [Streptomyces sp. NPDC004227]
MAYATVSDLEAWLAPEPAPESAVRLLEQASDRINKALYGAYFDLDDEAVREVLRKACVRQVHWMLERDDETGAQDDLQSMSTGSRSFTRRTVGQGAGQTPQLSSAAVDVLKVSGLFCFSPWVEG